MEKEIWRDVVGYEGLYQVSNLGNIKGIKKRKNSKLGIMSLSKNSKGYYKLTLYNNGQHETKKVHLIVAQAFLEKPNYKCEINHINGIKTDNRVENLEWITHKENIQHAIKNGLIKRKINQNAIKMMSLAREKKINLVILGNVYKTFDSITKASIELHINKKTITKHLKHKVVPNKIFSFEYAN